MHRRADRLLQLVLRLQRHAVQDVRGLARLRLDGLHSRTYGHADDSADGLVLVHARAHTRAHSQLQQRRRFCVPTEKATAGGPWRYGRRDCDDNYYYQYQYSGMLYYALHSDSPSLTLSSLTHMLTHTQAAR